MPMGHLYSKIFVKFTVLGVPHSTLHQRVKFGIRSWLLHAKFHSYWCNVSSLWKKTFVLDPSNLNIGVCPEGILSTVTLLFRDDSRQTDLHDFTKLRVCRHELAHKIWTWHHLLNKRTVEECPHHFWVTHHLHTMSPVQQYCTGRFLPMQYKKPLPVKLAFNATTSCPCTDNIHTYTNEYTKLTSAPHCRDGADRTQFIHSFIHSFNVGMRPSLSSYLRELVIWSGS